MRAEDPQLAGRDGLEVPDQAANRFEGIAILVPDFDGVTELRASLFFPFQTSPLTRVPY